MNAKDFIRAGKLSEARALLIQEVKGAPADPSLRTLLFQVLVLLGELDKAGKHLDAITLHNPESETGVQVYKNLLHAEIERNEVYGLEKRPGFLPEAPPYAEAFFNYLSLLSAGKTEEAEKALENVFADLPLLEGKINVTTAFKGFSDSDSFLMLFMEAIVHEKYVWIPLASLREVIVMTPPKTLFDTIWIPATITCWDGFTAQCYLPVLYQDSCSNSDERLKLGRMTDWSGLGGSFYKGIGQHVYQAGQEDVALLEIQQIVFSPNETVTE